MKVTGWIDWCDDKYEELPVELYAEAYGVVIKEMRERGYKFTGSYHQNGDFGVPLIDDKWKFRVSQRTWGCAMAAAYPEEIDDSDGYGYTTWAWVKPDGCKMIIPGDIKEEG